MASGGTAVPEDYKELITPLPIAPTMAACGTAAFRKERVISSDIATDPFWSLPADIAAAVRERIAADDKQFSGMRHDAATQRAFYICRNSERMMLCWTFPFCSFDQAAEMWALIDKAIAAGRELDTALAMHVYNAVGTGHQLVWAQ